MIKIKELDIVGKILLVVLLIILTYFLIFLILKSFFWPDINNVDVMIKHMTEFGNYEKDNYVNLITMVISLTIGLIIYLKFLSKETENVKYNNKKRNIDELKIIKRVLSKDERKVIKELEKTREITQDSLRFRLGWSKAKISTILSNLDRMRLIQRKREGKTYSVFLQKKKL